MFRIGEFSKIARVSCRLLRYYESLELITPASVDPASGYRYYSAAQLPRINRILVLRDLGLSLEQIGRVLSQELPAAELRGMLLMHRAEVERSIDAQRWRLGQIEGRLAQIEAEGQFSADDVLMRAEPARQLLSVRQTMPSFADGMRRAAALVGEIPRAARGWKLSQFIAIAHNPEFEPDQIDVEFGFLVDEPAGEVVVLPDGIRLRLRELPAVDRLAACVRVGSPEQAHQSSAQIGRFVERHGLRIAGPSRELFLQRPNPARIADSVIEMQMPLALADGTERPEG